MSLKVFLLISSLLSLPFMVKGVSLDVIINEIAWMGTENSSNDEWIELYNNTNEDINLENWAIYEGEILIEPLTGIIRANNYYLIERTDDTTVPNVSASQEPSSWTGNGLKNSGEDLKLLDNNSNIIDQVNCISGWFSGDNATKQTMERISSSISGNASSNWQTSQNPGGTPKSANGPPYQPPPPEPPPPSRPSPPPEPGETPSSSFPPASSNPTELAEPAPLQTEPLLQTGTETTAVSQLIKYPDGIIINEVLPSPEGADAENEWIEIFNQNNFEADISNWKIKDEEGKSAAYTFPENTKIKANGYLVLSRPITKITLNNEGDEMVLIRPDEEIADSMTYAKAPQGQSYNKIKDSWSWSSVLTPGNPNTIFQKISSASTEVKETEKSADIAEKGTAAISEKTSPKKSSSPVLIAVNLALFSGIAILILKRKLEESGRNHIFKVK